ncbi:Guanine deaminase, partial [hydrothermal vent metagenome]
MIEENQNMKILRGRTLSFLRQPEGADDASAYSYFEDGGVAINGSKIVGLGDFADISKQFAGEIIDHRPHLLLPGLIDPHLHFVQMQVVASYAANLLEWLNKYTFVEEQRFADQGHATLIASAFFDTLIRYGTTSAAAYCSVHQTSAEAFFGEAEKRNMLMIGGKCMMDRNCPEALQDTAQTGYDASKALAQKWHGRGRAKYAITPRFAITSSPEQLESVTALMAEFPKCYMQTHLSENMEEIAFTKELYPELQDYLAIYEHYEMLGDKSLFGHAIHLSDRELDAMAQSGSVAVSCPTSNLFLGSGLFDHDRAQKGGVKIAVATDIGGGTSFSMLKTMDEFYKIQQLNGNRFDPLLAFYRMTLGNAKALLLEENIGTLQIG